ncbi:MAG: nuclear transport factor 2 family protein [Chloroflexi bacterium]|nr:nuclear transport factor 2 family protein [Chloroflexota bacterium]
MKTKLFLICVLALCFIALVACAAPLPTATPVPPPPTPVPPPDPASLIKDLVGVLNAGNVDAVMAFFADAATQTMQPPPAGQSGVWTGKEQIRGFFQGLIADHFSVELSNVKVAGDKITYTCTFSTDSYKKLGVAPIVAVEDAVFEGGKIKSKTITVTPESLAKIQAAMAAAQAKAAPAPTTAPVAGSEVQASKSEDVLGVWLVISASGESHWEHAANGERYATAISGALKGIKTVAKYWFESDLYKIQYPQSTGEPNSTAVGTYRVYVTKQGANAIQLRFVVVDDAYTQRVTRMTYRPWTRVEQ